MSHPSSEVDCANFRSFLRIFQHTPGTYPRPRTNSLWFGIPFIWGFGEAWGMLQGYVGILLESLFIIAPRNERGNG